MAADPVWVERDGARFESLYREYAGDVYRYALAIMRNPADAEDVTQTTFLNAWRAYSAGEQPRAPLNWFISIAHNVCRLRFRTNSRRPREVEFEPALAEAPATEGPRASDVLDALAELPLNQRAAIVMRELEGRSYGDIATVLGVSRSAVETLIFRARRSLRVRREAIGSLALLPLPSSLTTFFRARGAVEAGAGAALGSGIAAKVVAVIAAGLVAGGAAHQIVLDDGNAQPGVRRVTPVRSVPAAVRPVLSRDEARQVPLVAPTPAPARPKAAARKPVGQRPAKPNVHTAPAPGASETPAAPSAPPVPKPTPARPPAADDPVARTVTETLPTLPALQPPSVPLPQLPPVPPVIVPPVPVAVPPPVEVPQPVLPAVAPAVTDVAAALP